MTTTAVAALLVAGCGTDRTEEAVGIPPADTLGAPGTTTGPSVVTPSDTSDVVPPESALPDTVPPAIP